MIVMSKPVKIRLLWALAFMQKTRDKMKIAEANRILNAADQKTVNLMKGVIWL